MEENRAVKFIKTTVTGGLLFLLPVVFILFILGEAVDYMLVIAEPMVDWVPLDTISGVALANLIAIIIVILTCFVAGLVARNAIASGLVKKLEVNVLKKIPGYTLLKVVTGGLHKDQTHPLRPVLLTLGTVERIGFEVQKLPDGRSMVFFPGAPNPLSGITQILPADQVTYLDVPIADVMGLSENYGLGADELLAKKYPAIRPGIRGKCFYVVQHPYQAGFLNLSVMSLLTIAWSFCASVCILPSSFFIHEDPGKL